MHVLPQALPGVIPGGRDKILFNKHLHSKLQLDFMLDDEYKCKSLELLLFTAGLLWHSEYNDYSTVDCN